MTNKAKMKLAWLYQDNHSFFEKQVDMPFNHEEIRHTFEIKYGVRDIPFVTRFLLALGAMVFTLIFTMVGISILLGWLSGEMGDISIGQLLITISFVLGSIYGIYVFLRLAFELILHRTKAVDSSLQKLLQEGVFLPASVINQSLRGGELTYEFLSPNGKRIKGKYYLGRLRRHRSESDFVAVWYYDDKIHTLL